MNSIKERLIKTLRELSLTQKDFASEIEISETSMTNYLKKNRIPNGDVLIKINKRFGISIDWLLTGNGEMMIQEATPNTRSAQVNQDKTYLEEIQEKLIKSQEREITELKNQLRSCNCSHKSIEEHK